MLGRVQTKEETGVSIMPLTHDFKETIRARAQRDPDFRHALLREAIECVINGDLATGKAVLRDYVNATIGFQNPEKRTDIPRLEELSPPPTSPSASPNNSRTPQSSSTPPAPPSSPSATAWCARSRRATRAGRCPTGC